MRIREINVDTWVKKDKKSVFEFFANPFNLLKVTPESFPIKILNKEEIVMGEGTEIKIRMRLYKLIPLWWKTKIIEWQPPDEFVDIQPWGPYRYWKHTHTFIEKDGGTIIRDKLEYAVPGFFLEPIIHKIFVEKNLKMLFDYRNEIYPIVLNEN